MTFETLMVDFGMLKQSMVDNMLVQELLIVYESPGCTWQAAPTQACRDCFGQIMSDPCSFGMENFAKKGTRRNSGAAI